MVIIILLIIVLLLNIIIIVIVVVLIGVMLLFPSMSDNGIMMMSIDNLPAQVPRESSDYFGSKMLPLMKDCVRLNNKNTQGNVNLYLL